MPCTYYVTTPGDRPFFWSIASFLWGPNPSFDSDGDSIPADSSAWTELTLHLRDGQGHCVKGERVDVDPYQEHPLILQVRSETASLALRVGYVLARFTGGRLSAAPDGPFRDPSAGTAHRENGKKTS